MFSLRRIWVEDILQSLPETGVHALPVIKVKGARKQPDHRNAVIYNLLNLQIDTVGCQTGV